MRERKTIIEELVEEKAANEALRATLSGTLHFRQINAEKDFYPVPSARVIQASP